MIDRSIARKWSPRTVFLFLPSAAVALLVAATLRHFDWNEAFFVSSAYYVLFALVAITLGVALSGGVEGFSPREWVRENLGGIVATASISTVVLLAVPSAFRVLADEANLVGVSKNLFASKTANFAVTGKWYFENYWNGNQTTDRRPALYPFLVSLLHTAFGYRVENAFHVNAIVFVLFVFTAYRLAKSLGGETFGVAASILVAASPNTLVAARSAGFDLLATFLLLVVVLRFHRYVEQPSARTLVLLALSMCLLAHVRVEGMGLLVAGAVALLAVRAFRWSHLRGYGWVYSLVPVFLAERYWQAVAKAHDAEQPLSASLFGRTYLVHNARAYFGLLRQPFDFDGPHARLVLIIGLLGCGVAAWGWVKAIRAETFRRPHVQLAVFVGALLAVEFVLSFTYMFGEPSQPASARLFLWLDTLVAFAAAWALTAAVTRAALVSEAMRGRRGSAVAAVASAMLFAMYVPVAHDARFINSLILTRQAAQTWRFFEKLGDKRILILTDRPGLYTIMNYGASDISVATTNKNCLFELSRHLYTDVYLIQEMSLQTKQPMQGFAAWPDVATQTVLEFQNTDSVSVRIARVTP